MYLIINALSDVIYELISALSPKPIPWFDIDKNPYRLYLCASRKLKRVDYKTVCDCVVYCSHVFGKDIKHVIFANKDITEEGIKSLMRLAKRVKETSTSDKSANNTTFIVKELKKVVENFNDSAIEAVGEAIINGVSYNEYIRRSGYNKYDFKVEPDAMWVVTHQVLNNIKSELIKKCVNKRFSYNEVVNSYITEARGIDTSALDYFHKVYHNKELNMANAANSFIRALNDGIDLTPFLKEKRLMSVYTDSISADELYPATEFHLDLDLNSISVSNNTLMVNLMDMILNEIYETRLSGADNETIIKYLRSREKLSTIDFINTLDDDMNLLQQRIVV